jgi:Uma2 family endonuclease
VNTSGSRRYPDVLVEPLSPDLNGRTSEAPIFIAEVLSPSSVSDMREKSSEYMELPSLQTYAVVSQNEPKVWLWTRDETGFPEKPAVIESAEKMLDVPALGVALPLAGIYRGIGCAPG